MVPDDEVDADGDGHRLCDEDCDDADPYLGAEELCDGRDNDCDGEVPEDELDMDGDGQAPCEGDCDDADPDTYLGAEELPDGIDNDCDGVGDADGLVGGACTCRTVRGDGGAAWLRLLLTLLGV